MKKSTSLLYVFLFLITSAAAFAETGSSTAADAIPPVITYTAIPVNSLNPTLSATISDSVDGVTGATIFWSINGGAFTPAACSLSSGTAQSGTWSCQITGMANPNAVKYYVTATDAALNTSTNPTGGATGPNLFTFGAATVPAGTYSNMNLGNGVSLGGNVDILSSLNINGIVNAGANKLTLECAATVSGGGEGSYVIGNVEKFICGATTFTYNVGAAFAVPPFAPDETESAPEGTVSNYSPLTVTITGGTVGSSLTVSVTDAFMGGAMQTNAISRFWTLTENGDLTANLTGTYRNEDVVGTETSYKVLRRTGSTTLYYPGGTVNAAANTFSAPGVSDFSQWTAGILIPTAASASISGRAVSSIGRGLANVTVSASDIQGNVVSFARTNSFGYFTLFDIPAGADYVVSAASKRQRFDPSSFIVSLEDSVTGISFVAKE